MKDEIENPVDYARYTPKCSKNDLNKMLDFHEYKKSKHYRKAEPKIRSVASAKRLDQPRTFFNNDSKPNPKRLITSATDKNQIKPSTYNILMDNSKNHDKEVNIIKMYEEFSEDGEYEKL